MDRFEDDAIVSLIEKERKAFINDESVIEFIEYGAGSRHRNGKTRKVSDVARSSLSGPWQCRLMYNIIKRYKPQNILEIGTSFGISSAYLASAESNSSIITLEGNPSSAMKARSLFKRLELDNIKLLEGEFNETIADSISILKKIDCAFIDGNHRKQATIDYFHKIRMHMTKGSFMIIDDIYWSTGMQEAWKEIISHESVAFSINLFRFGIVFFDDSIMEKQHFLLIDAKWKLWSIGVFG